MSRGVLWPQGFQRLLLGVLSPLCFSLLLGHILRISDAHFLQVMRAGGQSQRLLQVSDPRRKRELLPSQNLYLIPQRKTLIGLGWITHPSLDQALCARRSLLTRAGSHVHLYH